MGEHHFGGNWSKTKETALREYLNNYTAALKNQSFNLIYIDAFAGTGDRTVTVGENLFSDADEKTFEGSAQIALKTGIPFDKYIFIDQKHKYIKILNEMVERHPERLCSVIKGDANAIVQTICRETNWKKFRAVIFLDPYGMSVDWKTLECIKNTGAIDVWYLVSISGIFRQMPKDLSKMDEDKKKSLFRMFGENPWESEFYKTNSTPTLFDLDPVYSRETGTDQFVDYVTRKLNSLFPWVGKPIRIPTTGLHKFSLYLAMSNSEPKAIGLAQRLTNKLLGS